MTLLQSVIVLQRSLLGGCSLFLFFSGARLLWLVWRIVGGCGVSSLLSPFFSCMVGSSIVGAGFGLFSRVYSTLDLSVADWIASSGLGLSALRIVVGGFRDCGVFFSFFLLLVGGLVAALPFPFFVVGGAGGWCGLVAHWGVVVVLSAAVSSFVSSFWGGVVVVSAAVSSFVSSLVVSYTFSWHS